MRNAAGIEEFTGLQLIHSLCLVVYSIDSHVLLFDSDRLSILNSTPTVL